MTRDLRRSLWIIKTGFAELMDYQLRFKVGISVLSVYWKHMNTSALNCRKYLSYFQHSGGPDFLLPAELYYICDTLTPPTIQFFP